jgi:hypothetical protein
MMGLLPLIAAIAVAIFAVRRGAAHKVRGGGRRGVAARLACAALALGMLAVIAGSTWRSVFAPVEQTAGMAPCHLPTLPPPQRESDPGRVLVQMAVMRGSMAVKVEEFAVRLPEDIGHDFEFSRVVEGAQIGISYRLDRVPALDGTAPTWGDGQCSVSMRRWDEDISPKAPRNSDRRGPSSRSVMPSMDRGRYSMATAACCACWCARR